MVDRTPLETIIRETLATASSDWWENATDERSDHDVIVADAIAIAVRAWLRLPPTDEEIEPAATSLLRCLGSGAITGQVERAQARCAVAAFVAVLTGDET